MNSIYFPMSADLTRNKIAVLMGGPGSERPVSLKSGEGVVEALRSLGAEVTAVDVHGADFVLPAPTSYEVPKNDLPAHRRS